MFERNDSEKLINSLESLTYRDRILAVIDLGKKARQDPEVSLIDDLQQGNYYRRLLALYSCYGSYNGDRVLTTIADSSRSLRNKAIDLITVVGSDEQVVTAVESLNYKQCRTLFKYLRKRGRLSVIDRCLEKLIARQDSKLDKLLPYGTADIVSRHLDKILERAGVDEWHNLARLHPETALTALQRYAEQSTGKDWRLVWYFNRIIPRLSELYSDRVSSLVNSLIEHPVFSSLRWQNLVDYRPLESAQLALRIEDKAKIKLDSVAHKLPQDLLIELINRQPQTVNNYSQWLPKLKPEQRTQIYNQCNLGWRDRDGCMTIHQIKLFPTAIREKEARYHLDLPILQTRPTRRLPYAAYLTWDEAWLFIQPYLRNPDPDLRILALTTIIDATRYQRSHLPELLKIICDRRNEQDPVRCAMLSGLDSLPPSIWRQEHLADLNTILDDAFKAADLSQATGNYAEHLVLSILPFHPQWSVEWLAKLIQVRGEVQFYNLESRLNNSQVRQLAPVLLPVFKAWATREREWSLIRAASSFGKRLAVFDGLVDILERLLVDTPNTYHANWILSILKEHRRDRLAFLIPQLLKKDKSWFTQTVVNNYLHNFRQDLLTPYLGQTAYRGKFATGKTRFVLFFHRGYSRWTYRQQTIYGKSLEGLTRDDKRDTPAVWSALEELALLPAIEPTRLIELASLENPKEAIRDRALRALARLDSGQGVPVLVSALDDTRARIAIYALRKCLLEMPVDNAVSILQQVDSNKVTVNKEIVRLLGDLDSPSAYQELRAKTNQDCHRDVRIASLRALWLHLELDETWLTLEQAALDADEAVATMVGRTPGDRLSDRTQAKLISLLVTLLDRPEPTLRLAILQRCYQLPIRDSKQLLLPQLLKSLNSTYPDEVINASHAIFSTYRNPQLIAEAIKQIIRNRRSLNLVIANLQHIVFWNRIEFLPVVRAILAVLEIDLLTIEIQVKLAIAAFSGNELGDFLINLSNSNVLHSDALAAAIKTIESISQRNDIANIMVLESTLARSKDEKLRRLAVAALIAQTNSRLGWDREKVDRLLAYRQDTSPLVAAAAQFIFPPDNLIGDKL